MSEKVLYRLLLWLPFAVPLAGATVWAVNPLTFLYVWGSFGIPAGATLEELHAAALIRPMMYLIMLIAPKIAIYFFSKERWSFKKMVWNSATYMLLPLVAWFLFDDHRLVVAAWLIIAIAAWMEALQIVATPLLDQRTRESFRLE